MNHFICETCGIQYELTDAPPESCIICTEERQYVNPNGQVWTTMEQMIEKGRYQNECLLEEEGLYSITTTPSFGIGQTAYLIQNKGFNLLWDCLTLLDEYTIKKVKELGGLHAIALSHPHYYSSQVEWAEVFDIPIYIHKDDEKWVTRPSERIIFWSGETLELTKELVLHRLGGHFEGGAVLEWKEGCGQKGVLLTGDIIQIVPDNRWVSFMYSYPNLIPLPAAKVQEIADTVKGLNFDRMYNAFHRVIKKDANGAVQRSAQRYIAALNGTLFHT
ncbi:MBL fold metallo-hydrolase [Domibacillus robiginosus]|uniref:MBL fold metallo-hydrolase n=1 Tax=Domibacillus robiginosus TaxID=1071054 RepID=UPI00067B6585|nr:MBL fold metallo-hydrolase [Domibacillus robiginosus]